MKINIINTRIAVAAAVVAAVRTGTADTGCICRIFGFVVAVRHGRLFTMVIYIFPPFFVLVLVLVLVRRLLR